jgi:hypothetical protein
MDITIPLFHGFVLEIADKIKEKGDYATSFLPKGLLLVSNGLELTEEAVGFGFPVVKRGLEALFPGEIELAAEQHGSLWTVQAAFVLNQVDKISRSGAGTLDNRLLYATRNFLAAIIRGLPMFRRPLTGASNKLRGLFDLETTFVEAGFSTELKVTYTIEAETGKIAVEIDTSGLPADISEVVLMNEQGAHYFDRYEDSSGVSLQGEQIGCWDEVDAQEAWFESSAQQVTFRLSQVKGARLLRGRELIGSRLAWSGFGYSFPPSIQRFRYELKIEALV